MVSINPSKNPFLDGGATPSPTVVPAPTPRPEKEAPRPASPLPPRFSGERGASLTGASSVAPQVLASSSKRGILRTAIISIGIILLLSAGVFFWWRGGNPAPSEPSDETPPVPLSSPLSPRTPNQSEEASAPSPVEGNAQYTSENFKAGEIVIGGELQFLQNEEAIGPLTISGVRGETFTEKNKQEVKLIVTWETNRLSLGAVEYGKGVGQARKTAIESDYSYSHSLIIPGLDPASTYLYIIKSEDRFGNPAESESHAVFTGARSVSLFDLIAGAIGDVFGWAVDK